MNDRVVWITALLQFKFFIYFVSLFGLEIIFFWFCYSRYKFQFMRTSLISFIVIIIIIIVIVVVVVTSIIILILLF